MYINITIEMSENEKNFDENKLWNVWEIDNHEAHNLIIDLKKVFEGYGIDANIKRIESKEVQND